MKLKIDDKAYSMTALEDLGLWDLLEIKKQTGCTLEDIKRDAARMQELQEDDAGEALFSDAQLLTSFGIMVWIARRKAGEDITFRDAVDIPFRKLEWIEEEGDEQAGEA